MPVMERDVRQHDTVRYHPLWSICLRRGLRLRVQHPSRERPYGMYTSSADVRTRLVPIEPEIDCTRSTASTNVRWTTEGCQRQVRDHHILKNKPLE